MTDQLVDRLFPRRRSNRGESVELRSDRLSAGKDEGILMTRLSAFDGRRLEVKRFSSLERIHVERETLGVDIFGKTVFEVEERRLAPIH